MERFSHGGDIYTHPGLLDVSASLNPLGMPAAAARVLRAQVRAFEAYPDPRCCALTRALARFEGVEESWVLPCAGATDALARLCQVVRARRALVCAPCYSGYEQALVQAGSQVVYHDLRADTEFAVGPEMAAAIDEGVQLVFLANPNNPTGRCLDRAVLRACLKRAHEVGALVVLDECFVDLTREPGSTDLLGRHPHLVIVKALTKTFCLAGLRVGYALCSDGDLLDRLRAVGQPWAVSVPAQLAGVACLQDDAYLEESRALIAHERAFLCDALARQGLRVLPSQANYLLMQGPVGLDAALRARGVLVRSCANFRCLDESWYRVAVRTHEQNEVLIAALEEAMTCVQSR